MKEKKIKKIMRGTRPDSVAMSVQSRFPVIAQSTSGFYGW